MDIDLATADFDGFSSTPIKTVDFNLTDLTVFQISDDSEITPLAADPVYDQFLADVWVGTVLTLLVLSCVCFMCSCLVYHKFQEWKHRSESRNGANLEAGLSEADLPSYTIASGLPTYEEALEQLKKSSRVNYCPKEAVACDRINERINLTNSTTTTNASPSSNNNNHHHMNNSLFNLFGIYNKSGECFSSKPA